MFIHHMPSFQVASKFQSEFKRLDTQFMDIYGYSL